MMEDCGFGRSIVRELRAAWQRDTGRRQGVRELLWENPGRAEGRVADWSIDRIVDYLRRDSRRPLRFADPDAGELTGDERQIINLLEDLRNADVQQTEMRAQWLVKLRKVEGLLARLRPLADITNCYDITDAVVHRRSARAILYAHQHGAS